jgi:wyosine [tRNA(Phe)-imidazoG37] synthetase (radical SAM superfamily)
VITRAYYIFDQKVNNVETLIGYEGNAFAFTGDVEQDLLSIMAVHPMREEAVDEFLSRAAADWSVVNNLVSDGHLVEILYDGKRFFIKGLN